MRRAPSRRPSAYLALATGVSFLLVLQTRAGFLASSASSSSGTPAVQGAGAYAFLVRAAFAGSALALLATWLRDRAADRGGHAAVLPTSAPGGAASRWDGSRWVRDVEMAPASASASAAYDADASFAYQGSETPDERARREHRERVEAEYWARVEAEEERRREAREREREAEREEDRRRRDRDRARERRDRGEKKRQKEKPPPPPSPPPPPPSSSSSSSSRSAADDASAAAKGTGKKSQKWAAMEERWAALESRAADGGEGGGNGDASLLGYDDIPWPPKMSALLTHTAGGAGADQRATKMAYMKCVRRWHPDKFAARYGARLRPSEREKTLERVGAVARALNAAFAKAQRGGS